MATIGTAIKLNDMMSAPIRNITNAMNMMLSSWTSLENATADGLDVNNVESIRAELNQATRALDQMGEEQEEFNRQVEHGQSAMDGLTNSIMGAVGAYVGFQGLQKLANLSDTYTQTVARLNMVNDGTQTTAELTDKVFASAQRSRAAFGQTADTVAKLALNAGSAFKSNNETILFAENLNKLFVIAGTEQAAIASASLQLTQALGSGVLRGEEFNAVFEAAPNIMQTVADYMGVPIGQLRSMAAEGKITADIVKNALIGATGDINAQFESMPMTWGQVWNGVMNELYQISVPVLEVISALAENWSVLEPIVIAAAVAVGLYTAAMIAYKAVAGGMAAIESIRAAATAMSTGATFAATAAQYGFNAALWACPITWILAIIIAVIAAIYAVVAAINKARGTTVSATGVIMGVVYTLFSYLWNIVASFVNFFANVWNDPIGSIIRLFASLADNVLGVLEVIAKGIDFVFGSNLASTIAGWRSKLAGMVEEKYGTGVEVMAKMDQTEAFNKGYEVGAEFEAKIGDIFGGEGLDLGGALDGIGGGVAETAGNTGGIADALEITNEDLKYLRDLAEQEVINRFTTAEIRVEMGGVNNTVNQNTDLDGVIDYMVTGVQEAMERVAEGVHN